MIKYLNLPVLSAIGLAVLLAGGTAWAQGIDGSPHDLATPTSVGDNGEICVYCHTPHGSNTGVEAPLWNKPNNTASYSTYDSTTVDGTVLAVGSVSLACLTCHDGTQAMDTVINAPGSGGFNAAGAEMDPTAGPTMPAGITNLGTDLSNDHPIGVQYGGLVVGAGKIDPDFKGTGEGLQTAQINGLDRWWVDTEASPDNSRDKTDMILYTRDNGGTAQPFVECASCHDPHNNSIGTFLRVANVDSAVCLACHTK
jgi:predicted CXXCH cytochrome family protein